MQINNKIKGSILIWAIFLSLVISISFISLSSKINKSIKNDSSATNNYEFQTSIKNKDYLNKDIGNNEELIYDDSKSYKKTLKFGENTEVRISSTSSANINLKINYGGPIFYNFTSFSGTTASGATNSGIIDNNINFTGNLSTNYKDGILYIKNLGGNTNFELSSSETLTTQYKNYKITKQVGNKRLIKKEGSIKIFDLGVFNGIDYKKNGFYF